MEHPTPTTNPLFVARAQRNISRNQLAIALDLSYCQIANAEQGRLGSLETWRARLNAAGFDADRLITDYAAWRRSAQQPIDAKASDNNSP